VPIEGKQNELSLQLKECTFKPEINSLSVLLDAKLNKNAPAMAGKIVRRSEDGSFSYS